MNKTNKNVEKFKIISTIEKYLLIAYAPPYLDIYSDWQK